MACGTVLSLGDLDEFVGSWFKESYVYVHRVVSYKEGFNYGDSYNFKSQVEFGHYFLIYENKSCAQLKNKGIPCHFRESFIFQFINKVN